MKIITVDKPVFKWNDRAYVAETQRLGSKTPFREIQKEINKQESNGMTHCFIYSITNSPTERIMDETDELIPGLMIRWYFTKIDNTEHNLGKNVSRIEEMLRDNYDETE
jgi:hypothetical protein